MLLYPSYTAQWKDIESKLVPGVHIQAILSDKNLPRYINDLENPWVKSVLKVWEKVIKEHDLEEDIQIRDAPIWISDINISVMADSRYLPISIFFFFKFQR